MLIFLFFELKEGDINWMVLLQRHLGKKTRKMDWEMGTIRVRKTEQTEARAVTSRVEMAPGVRPAGMAVADRGRDEVTIPPGHLRSQKQCSTKASTRKSQLPDRTSFSKKATSPRRNPGLALRAPAPPRPPLRANRPRTPLQVEV